ncbi:MAG: type II toxin-antitoxin system HipA family toxin [Alphaproteobacteria bacterium]|nr:type II toxin-antitoxin system HipA family toxin [Alphaproteobacteria bacterium]
MRLNVYLNAYQKRQFVGVLEGKDEILFEYAPSFLKTGINLSPFMLPLKSGIFFDKKQTFEGLFGLFNDSLPDGWGCLLLDRYLQKQGLSYYDITPLHRLSIVGKESLGALEYEPKEMPNEPLLEEIELDELSFGAHQILEGASSDWLDYLKSLNGSTAGARPKITAQVSDDFKTIRTGREYQKGFSQWIIKFSSDTDERNLGALEYIYSLMAKKAGIDMPDTYLFPSKNSAGHFAVKRFDRQGKNKIHVHSACGLLHASHRIPTLDYENLIRLTSHLTHDEREVEKMVRLMIFNVKSGNKDDHTKNFAYMMTKNYEWKMTPAFDITPSNGINGEQTAMVNGKGRKILNEDLIEVAKISGLSLVKIKQILQEVEESLSFYPILLREFLGRSSFHQK